MADIAVIVVVVVACIAAYILSIAPVVPGSLFIPLGAAVVGLIEGFDVFPWWFWVGQVVLVVAGLVIDNVAQVVGVQKIGGSRRAMIGGTIGVIVGPLALAPLINVFAVLLGPPVGAVAGTLLGEWSHRRRIAEQGGPAPEAGMHRIGIGALLAWAVGTGVRLGLVTMQVAWLLLELE